MHPGRPSTDALVNPQKMSSKHISIKDFFRSQGNGFAAGMRPSPGFSFQSDAVACFDFAEGVSLKSCKKSTDGEKQSVKAGYVHPATGVKADVNYAYFADTNVLEMDGELTNGSRKTLKNVGGPFSLCIEIDITGLGEPRMTSLHDGGNTSSAYPPPAWNVFETSGVRSLIGGRENGRSTETDMPYVFITDAKESCGLFIAYEWPCRWIFCTGINTVKGRRIMRLLVHVAYTSFTLKPGESIGIPKVNLGLYRGNAIDGSNALRRHIVQHVRRPIRDGSMLPPVFYNHYYGLYPDWTVKTQMKEARAYAELGMEYYVVDADWYLGSFRAGNGNWEHHDPKRFPDGMEAFADYVRSLGMKFGSWLEPEWAMKNSRWVKEHPDWFHYAPEKQNYFYGTPGFDDVLLKLDDAKVRAQVADFLEWWVNRYGIEWLRWDFNNVAPPFWEANEGPNDWGKIQLQYGLGLYALLDEFMARCPQVHIESCAGGGHRMDMGTLRRAHSAWVNDNSHAYHSIRQIEASVNRIQPGCYSNSAFLYATHPHQRVQSLASVKKNGYPPAVLRSRMAGSLCFSEQSRLFTPQIKKTLKSEIENYKQQRHLLLKDFYPLFRPQSLAEYDGWQFHDPETGEGFFQVFRCESPQARTEVHLPGLSSRRSYELKDVDTGRKRSVKGGKNFTVNVPRPNGVKWYQYRAK